jgi:DNA polymerase IIIc chi subunit
MNNSIKSIQIDFYYISSNFSEILLKLGEKLMGRNHKTLVLVDKLKDLNDMDKLLWVKEKSSFLPHKLINEKIYEQDKIILSQKSEIPDYLEKKFDTLIISPEKSIKSFKLFKRFLVFCYKGCYQNFDSYKIKLESLGFTVNGFEEFNTFKWKSL